MLSHYNLTSTECVKFDYQGQQIFLLVLLFPPVVSLGQ